MLVYLPGEIMDQKEIIKAKMNEIYQSVKNARSTQEIFSLYSEFLKLDVMVSTNHPLFSYDLGYYNCYSYAQNFSFPPLFQERYELFESSFFPFNPGFIGNPSEMWTDDINQTIDNFYADCDALKMKVYNNHMKDLPQHGGYSVLFYMEIEDGEVEDFHFLRRNQNGVWSHKEGFVTIPSLIVPTFVMEDTLKLVKSFEIVKPIVR